MRSMKARPGSVLTRLVLLLSWLCAGCAVQVQEHELWVRHDEERDSLELLLVMHGVCAAPNKLEQALPEVSTVLDGRRQVGFGWMTAVNLDGLPEPDPEDPDDLTPQERAFLNEIEVRSEAFLDEERRLGVVQRIRVPRASFLLERIDERVRAAWTEAFDPDPSSERDQEGSRLRHEAAASGWCTVSFLGSRLWVRFPATEEEAGRFMRELLGESEQGLREVPLESIRIADDRVDLVFGSGDDAAWKLSIVDESVEYSNGLRQALAEAGHELPGRSIDSMRAAFRWGGPGLPSFAGEERSSDD